GAHGATLTHVMVAGAASIGLILFGVTLMLTRGVTGALRGMVRDMRKLASGDFNVVLPGLGRGDEIGAMAKAVEQFKAKAVERARQEAEQEDAAKRAATAARKAEMHRLADRLETARRHLRTAGSPTSSKARPARSPAMPTPPGNCRTWLPAPRARPRSTSSRLRTPPMS